MALTEEDRREMENAGRRAFRSMRDARHWGALLPVTMSASAASRYHLPAAVPDEARAAWCAGFDAARDSTASDLTA